jgi:hypothetical protein
VARDRPGIGTCCRRTPRSLKRHRISHARTLAQDPVPPEYSIVGSARTLRPPRAARGMHIARPVDGHETGPVAGSAREQRPEARAWCIWRIPGQTS